jgi:hypothetical protein
LSKGDKSDFAVRMEKNWCEANQKRASQSEDDSLRWSHGLSIGLLTHKLGDLGTTPFQA